MVKSIKVPCNKLTPPRNAGKSSTKATPKPSLAVNQPTPNAKTQSKLRFSPNKASVNLMPRNDQVTKPRRAPPSPNSSPAASTTGTSYAEVVTSPSRKPKGVKLTNTAPDSPNSDISFDDVSVNTNLSNLIDSPPRSHKPDKITKTSTNSKSNSAKDTILLDSSDDSSASVHILRKKTTPPEHCSEGLFSDCSSGDVESMKESPSVQTGPTGAERYLSHSGVGATDVAANKAPVNVTFSANTKTTSVKVPLSKTTAQVPEVAGGSFFRSSSNKNTDITGSDTPPTTPTATNQGYAPPRAHTLGPSTLRRLPTSLAVTLRGSLLRFAMPLLTLSQLLPTTPTLLFDLACVPKVICCQSSTARE